MERWLIISSTSILIRRPNNKASKKTIQFLEVNVLVLIIIIWLDSKIAAFFSAKLNPTQQNYPVHNVELLVGIETMLRHKNLLQGTHFY